MNEKLQLAMKQQGDSQQDLANYLGLRGYQSVYRKLYGKEKWKPEQIRKICKRYRKTAEQLGL